MERVSFRKKNIFLRVLDPGRAVCYNLPGKGGKSMPHIIIGQILGIVAPIVTFISYQVNSKNKLLILQTVATVTICISYLLLGGNSGFALNIVCAVRNLTFFFLDPKSKANRIAAVILALAMGGMGMLSWEGPISALMVVALMANTIFMSFGDPQLLRKSVIGTSSLILTYNIFMAHPTIGGIMNESIAIVASIIGVLIYRKKKGEQ